MLSPLISHHDATPQAHLSTFDIQLLFGSFDDFGVNVFQSLVGSPPLLSDLKLITMEPIIYLHVGTMHSLVNLKRCLRVMLVALCTLFSAPLLFDLNKTQE